MSPTLPTRTKEAFWGLVGPWLFISISARFLPQTLAHLYQTSPSIPSFLSTVLLSPDTLRGALFGQFWAFMGPNVRDGASDKVLPLLDGRTTGGRVVPAPAGPGVGGVVVEIGPATGLWVHVFSERHLFQQQQQQQQGQGQGQQVVDDEDEDEDENDKPPRNHRSGKQKRKDTARTPVTKVYGVEPNAAHHGALRRAIEAAGLQDIYEIVPVGIEDLSSSPSSSSSSSSSSKNNKKWEGKTIPPGSVDCIVSILCLCSIPDPKRNVRALYELLRPGGRWYIYEHVRVEYSWYMRLYQRLINLVWPHFLGGCELCRTTEKTLRGTGPWSNIDVGQPIAEQWYACVPHRLGVFTK